MARQLARESKMERENAINLITKPASTNEMVSLKDSSESESGCTLRILLTITADNANNPFSWPIARERITYNERNEDKFDFRGKKGFKLTSIDRQSRKGLSLAIEKEKGIGRTPWKRWRTTKFSFSELKRFSCGFSTGIWQAWFPRECCTETLRSSSVKISTWNVRERNSARRISF